MPLWRMAANRVHVDPPRLTPILSSIPLPWKNTTNTTLGSSQTTPKASALSAMSTNRTETFDTTVGKQLTPTEIPTLIYVETLTSIARICF